MDNTGKEDDNTTAAKIADLPKNDETDHTPACAADVPSSSSSVPTAADDDVPAAADCKTDGEPETTATAADSADGNRNHVSDVPDSAVPVHVEANNSDVVAEASSSNYATAERDLNEALASTTISDAVDVEPHQDDRCILDVHHEQETVTVTPNNDNSIVETANSADTTKDANDAANTTEPVVNDLNSIFDGDFEGISEYVDVEFYDDTKVADEPNEPDQNDNAENCNGEGLLNNGDDLAEGQVTAN